MAFASQDPFAAMNRRPSNTRTSWSNNGVHFTVETSSYATPGFSFGSFGGTTNGGPNPALNPRRQSTGLFGAAFNILGDVLAQQQAVQNQNARRRNTEPYVDDMAYGDDSESEEQDVRPARQTLFSRFAERLANNPRRAQRGSRSQQPSPVRKAPRRSQTSRSYRTEDREPSRRGRWARVDDEEEEEDDDMDEFEEEPVPRRRPQPRRAFTVNDGDLIEALENAAEHHRREVRSCKRRLQDASRRHNANSAVLQKLVNDLKLHEEAYEKAKDELDAAMEDAKPNTSQRRSQRSSRNHQQRQPPRNAEDLFNDPFFASFFQTRRASHPVFANDDDFDAFFANPAFGAFPNIFGTTGRTPLDDNMNAFFSMPGASTSSRQRKPARSGAGNTGNQFRQPPGFTAFAAPQPAAPPPNLMKPEEAKRLFKIYNERWNTLAPTEPNIPYPARGMQATALSIRETIWAPLVSSSVATWSEETVMQANAQAFYLGVVGLTPQYTEAPGTGRIIMGYDKIRARPEQVKELIDMLKKEKMRWHSDRLGRRNGGTSSMNEALQRDERARAVFHAVCELMETAQ